MTTTQPNLGIVSGFAAGENGWDDEMNKNLRTLDRLCQASVADKDLTAPPGSPANGDAYIVAAGATGDWAGHDDELAVWHGAAAVWEFHVPKDGWRVYVRDESMFYVFNDSKWGVERSVSLGHLYGAEYVWDSSTQLHVAPGEVLVNGAVLSWGTNITVSGFPLSASTLYYLYLFDNSGTPDIQVSTIAPAWNFDNQYWDQNGDPDFRCLGYFVTDTSGNAWRFHVTELGRTAEFVLLEGSNADRLLVTSGSNAGYVSFSLSPLVPSHASHWFAAVKIDWSAQGDDAILAMHPVNIGALTGGYGLYTVRDACFVAGTKTFFGRVWLPIVESQTYYYGIAQNVGTPTADIEAHGARFTR